MAHNTQRLDDGFSTIITLANLPAVKLYEKEVTPPGVSGGGPIDTTTMRNVGWRTQAPKVLKSLAPVTVTVALATEAIPLVTAQVGINQLIVVQLPDTSQMKFYGWPDEFTPGAFTEGEQPVFTLTLQPSNRDANGAEVAPWYVEPEGSAADL